jgi:sulfoxide reductase catalytic subunit YedY
MPDQKETSMLIRTGRDGFQHPAASDITPRAVYEDRRRLLKWMATGAAGAALGSWAQREALAQQVLRPGKLPAIQVVRSSVPGAVTMEKLTGYEDASTYNNFYEFGTDKDDPARNAHTLKTRPWTVEVEGLVKKPGRYALEDLVKLGAQEERIYRLRCVEGWSMVIPWVGYSLSHLVNRVEPLGNAKFVEFVTLADRKTMPYVGSRVLEWPYVEGLRMDEAMQPLTLLASACTARCFPTRTARPCDWWCPGSTASRAPRAW